MQAGERQQGFTLLAALAALFLLALATQQLVFVLAQESRRQREEALLEAGEEIARALRAYHAASPGGVRTYPRTLDELLEDPRFLGIKRHLRRVRPDPLGQGAPWVLLRDADGGIVGVHSAQQQAPLQTAPRRQGRLLLPAATRYADWKFLYPPPPHGANAP